MLFLRWLILHSSLIAIVFCTLAKQEKLTLEIDEEEGSKSTITFEPVGYLFIPFSCNID